MSCDLCGKSGPTSLAKIEGATYKVCANCKQYGSEVKTVTRRQPRTKRNDDRVVVANYASIIRKARQHRDMTQDDFAQLCGVKKSEIHSFEQGSRVPTINTAEQLQKRLSITLLEEDASTPGVGVGYSSDGGSGLTLGDLMKKK